jgi:hypothetical protein
MSLTNKPELPVRRGQIGKLLFESLSVREIALPASGGTRYGTESPVAVSEKREYSRTRPETFANCRPEFTNSGA